MVSLTDLPIDVLRSIVDSLDARSAIMLLKTCRTCRGIVGAPATLRDRVKRADQDDLVPSTPCDGWLKVACHEELEQLNVYSAGWCQFNKDLEGIWLDCTRLHREIPFSSEAEQLMEIVREWRGEFERTALFFCLPQRNHMLSPIQFYRRLRNQNICAKSAALSPKMSECAADFATQIRFLIDHIDRHNFDLDALQRCGLWCSCGIYKYIIRGGALTMKQIGKRDSSRRRFCGVEV